MKGSIFTVGDELAHLQAEAQSLLSATADTREYEVVEARKRLRNALDESREPWTKLLADISKRARARGGAIRGDFYQALGFAFGLGAYVAFVHLGRRN
jgi:ElaB/YqjD/DUF883 family membrane-anchored ribosome-binding protein